MKGISWATVVSIGVHGALVTAMAYAPAGWLDEAMAIDPIDFEIFAPDETVAEPEPDAVEPESPPPEDLPPEILPEPQRVVSAVLRPQVEPFEPGAIDSSVDPSLVPSRLDVPSVTPETGPGPLDPEEERRRLRVLLAPGNAARLGFHATGPGPSQRGAPAGLQRGRRGPLTEAEAETLHSGYLRRQAMEKAWITREEPELRRQADGSYRYQGQRMTAIIRPDGDVRFEHTAVQSDGFSASGSFDLTEALMGSSGQNPHQAAEDWFMRRTAELRHRLETEHRRRTMSSGLRRLPGRLAGIWNDERRGGYTRRRALFRVWDEMEDDESGAAGRGIVMVFIRDALPAGSEDAYTEHELDGLNASRESTERFDPY